jgi:dTMP kinase
MYIVIEGIDTVGKSTQIEKLKQKLLNYTFTKEPGGTEFGKQIREIALFQTFQNPKTELFLFLSDRSEHYKSVIENTLNVLSDRSFISGIAYALSNKDFDEDWLIELNLFAINNHLPDKVILFEIDEANLIQRLSNKSNDKIEKRGIDYLLNIQKIMKKIIIKLNIDFIVVDATLSREVIHKKILNFIA